MSARSKARKQALDILFESDLRQSSPTELLQSRLEVIEGPDARPIREYAKAVVTGVVPHKGTFVRLVDPPADGRLMRGEQGVDVGDQITVRLLAADPARGFIDFERV